MLQSAAVFAQDLDAECRNLLRLAKKHYLELGEKETAKEFETIINLCGGSIAAEARAWLEEQKNKRPVETITVKGVSFEMVFVEGGTFLMGCTSEQGGDCFANESPNHLVTVSDFYISKYEITQGQWEAIMGTSIRQQRDKANREWPIRGEGSNYPMYYVSWNEVQEFISRLNSLTGKQYRLPTEAEWEYAARGGKKSKGYKYSGSNFIEQVAWYKENSNNATHPVGSKQPNELGIYDMSGNVYEWCYDWYGAYGSGSQTNPVGPGSGSVRVNRGGSWSDIATYIRVSDRNSYAPSYRYGSLGFRLVCPK